MKAEFARAGVGEEPSFWVASGRGFSHEHAHPTDVGHHFAGVWQGLLDIVEAHGGVRLPIDVNVASVPSPSGHVAVAPATPGATGAPDAPAIVAEPAAPKLSE
jgi:hypothetical protein